ncbi:MAG: SIS domain-containing protein [Anaerolineae bacterium]|nr:SIS domain-containing protein [Anaerolineae bacterium]
MSTRGESTYREIVGQPEAWAQAAEVGLSAARGLRDLWQRSQADRILFTGCGSTHYLSLAAAAMAREAGLHAHAMPASEVWLFPTLSGDLTRTMLVAVSRSGETSETVHAVTAFRRAGGRAAVYVGCYPQAALAGLCDLALTVPKAQEVSVAQTRSFASMLILCRALVAALAEQPGSSLHLDELPAIGERLLGAYAVLAERLGADMSTQRFFFLGSGPRYGLACETMLKMKEMSLSYSEAYHPLEFRHGPKSVVNEESLVIGLLSDEARAQEVAVLSDMRALGARTLAVVEGAGPGELSGVDDAVLLGSGLPMADRLVLYLPVLQLLAYHRAMANGQDPDVPRNLTAVVTLPGER